MVPTDYVRFYILLVDRVYDTEAYAFPIDLK